MGLLDRVKAKAAKHLFGNSGESSGEGSVPPPWMPATETSYARGKYNEAPEEEYEAAELFCDEYPPDPPRLLPSQAIDHINSVGCKAWGIEHPNTPRFTGDIRNSNPESKGSNDMAVSRVTTGPHCRDTCLLSTLPILAGLYSIQGKTGVYYEIKIHKMKGFIAIGTACRPYPVWRLPGWNRLSAAWHMDDFCKFFEDPDGGMDYVDEDEVEEIQPGDVVGCGYEFNIGAVFFTYNGKRLPNAFTGLYMPRQQHDVFAAIGVDGETDFEVNFGGELFRWKEGNEWAWRVEGHVGTGINVGSSRMHDEDLPAYTA